MNPFGLLYYTVVYLILSEAVTTTDFGKFIFGSGVLLLGLCWLFPVFTKLPDQDDDPEGDNSEDE